MKIITLVEDTKGEKNCKYEHGLSLYIETLKHKILYDVGATSAFIDNAYNLGVDLSQIDIIILSHGHYDHCGGLLDFLSINPTVTIYIQQCAGADYYNLNNKQEKYIGIEKNILKLPQVRLLEGDYRIDDELFLFCNRHYEAEIFNSNMFLKEKLNDQYIQDKFIHEQNLVIKYNDKNILLLGCAHNGIINILNTYKEYYDTNPCVAIGGFHLIKNDEYDDDEFNMILEIANTLNKMDTVFYTGHCTGKQAFDIMKRIMKDKLYLIHSGTDII